MKKGNIGYILSSDNQQLFKVDSILGAFIYVRSIEGPLTFCTVLDSDFWVVLDSLE